MTTDLMIVLADNANPGRTVGLVLGRFIILGLIIWGIVHVIRKRRRNRAAAQQPAPYWDGQAWQYPPAPGAPQSQTSVPQTYWDGQAWQYPPQQPPYPLQTHQHQWPQPPHQQYPPQPYNLGAPYWHRGDGVCFAERNQC